MTKLRLAVVAVFVVLGCDFEALRIEACFDAGLCNDAGVPIATGGGSSAAGGSTAGGSAAGGSAA
ncbi:MAG: hypothetical protein GQE15_37100, partial [Archangiaceae bacterium]|nr:hypothetical protein [Archangiaceae bacterium]